jgi:hypothetical protein
MPLAIFTDAMDDLTGTLGETAVYTPGDGGAAVSGVPVNVEIEVEGQPDGYNGTAWTQIQTVEGLLADFGQEPNEGDTIEMAGTIYTVKRVLENDGIFVKMAVR